MRGVRAAARRARAFISGHNIRFASNKSNIFPAIVSDFKGKIGTVNIGRFFKHKSTIFRNSPHNIRVKKVQKTRDITIAHKFIRRCIFNKAGPRENLFLSFFKDGNECRIGSDEIRTFNY